VSKSRAPLISARVVDGLERSRVVLSGTGGKGSRLRSNGKFGRRDELEIANPNSSTHELRRRVAEFGFKDRGNSRLKAAHTVELRSCVNGFLNAIRRMAVSSMQIVINLRDGAAIFTTLLKCKKGGANESQRQPIDPWSY
jgi:hypothetical protein